MKSFRAFFQVRYALHIAVCLFLLAFAPSTTHAAPDAAEVAGDLKVGGIHFSVDGNVVRKLSDLTSPWTITNSDIYFQGGNVGIGTLTPTAKLDVAGTIKAGGTISATNASGDGIFGFSNTTSGVVGMSSANFLPFIVTRTGVLGLSDIGTGVYGTSGSGNGITGTSNAGDGVYGSSIAGYAGNFQGNVNVTGNVGIGTVSPTHKLEVIGNADITGTVTAGNVTANNLVTKSGAIMTGPLTLPSNGFVVGSNQIIASNGFIGIGTINPGVPLDVVGDARVSGLFRINSNNNVSCPSPILGENTDGSLTISVPYIYSQVNGCGYYNNSSVLTVAKRFNTPLVGIGTTTPNRQLHIYSPDATAEISLEVAGTANNKIWNISAESAPLPDLDFRVLNDAGTAATRQVLSLKNNGSAVFSGDLSAVNASFSGSLIATNGVTGTRTTGESISIYGINNSTDAPTVEGWNTGSGDIYRGWSGAYPGHTLKYRVFNNGAVWALNGYTQGSDLRLKTEIHPLENTLDKVLKLRGVSYVMKTDETRTRRIGVIAQELELEYPELVATDDKGMKSVAYANLTAVLIEAVKGLKVENDSLKADNADMKGRLERLEKLVAGLK